MLETVRGRRTAGAWRGVRRGMLSWMLAGAIWLAAAFAAGLTPSPAFANEAAPLAADPALEARVMAIAAELRCLVCQNQTIADSNADLAVDLRRQVRQMLSAGRSQQEVLDYMTARYGDFVLYRPPLKDSTALLWFGPALLLVGGLVTLFVVLRRRARLPADRFDPDDPADRLDADPLTPDPTLHR